MGKTCSDTKFKPKRKEPQWLLGLAGIHWLQLCNVTANQIRGTWSDKQLLWAKLCFIFLHPCRLNFPRGNVWSRVLSRTVVLGPRVVDSFDCKLQTALQRRFLCFSACQECLSPGEIASWMWTPAGSWHNLSPSILVMCCTITSATSLHDWTFVSMMSAL